MGLQGKEITHKRRWLEAFQQEQSTPPITVPHPLIARRENVSVSQDASAATPIGLSLSAQTQEKNTSIPEQQGLSLTARAQEKNTSIPEQQGISLSAQTQEENTTIPEQQGISLSVQTQEKNTSILEQQNDSADLQEEGKMDDCQRFQRKEDNQGIALPLISNMRKLIALFESELSEFDTSYVDLCVKKIKKEREDSSAGQLDLRKPRNVVLDPQYKTIPVDFRTVVTEKESFSAICNNAMGDFDACLEDANNSLFVRFGPIEKHLGGYLNRNFPSRQRFTKPVNQIVLSIEKRYRLANQDVADKAFAYARLLSWVKQVVATQWGSTQKVEELHNLVFRKFKSPYPTIEEKSVLLNTCAMTSKQIANWMINWRSRYWKALQISIEESTKAKKLLIELKSSEDSNSSLFSSQ